MVTRSFILACCFLVASNAIVHSQTDVSAEITAVHPMAILPFQERGSETKGLGAQISDLLFANLASKPEFYLVERELMKEVLTEQALNVSGLVNPETQTRIGQMTGAKILVTGTVLQVNDSMYLVAKVIGTETTRVLGASVKGHKNDDLDKLAQQLSEKVATTVSSRSADLVAKNRRRADRIAKLKKKLSKSDKPSILISISERHVGEATVDPASETELTQICKDVGFTVIDPERGDRSDAEIVITGEGFSEFAARHGDLTSVKARLELKITKRDSREIVAVGRRVDVAADLGENIAAKKALQQAAASLAAELLPKIVKGS